MYKYPINIELLSETIFGNGQSKNGIVNTDVLLDEEGFPYYLGKTFKGCLKNSINTILKPYYKGDEFENSIKELFGFSYKGKEQEGKLKFTNFYLDNNIIDIFNEYKGVEDRKDLILSSLTDIRFGIKMGENGVSEDKSLRASRVLKKGLTFNGFVYCEEKLKENEFDILEKGIKSLKNLGISKSRGKGLVTIKIGKETKLKSEKCKNINGDFDYLLYEVNLKQPVKIGDSQSQYDYEQTKSYISGSIVRGSVIGKYLKVNKLKGDKVEKDKKFNDLLKKVHFYDSYPIYETSKKEKYYSFPTPNVFRTTKDIDKEDKDEYIRNDQFSIVFDNKKINKEPTVIRLKKGDFSYYNNDILYQFNIKKDYRFHHSKETEKENIFRYESISKGQRFYGVVDVSNIDNDLKKDLYKLLSKKQILYLGGSRTSGYGETEICNIETIEDFNELQQKLEYFKADNTRDKLNIYFLSDSILRDEQHQIISSFSDEYLNQKFKVNPKDVQQEINSVILSGYNTKWKSVVPHVYGIEKGSVIRINLNDKDNKIDKKDIEIFIKEQHGDRKQDGLGRVIINPKFLDINEIKYIRSNEIFNNERQNSNFKVKDETIDYMKKCKDDAIINNCIKSFIVSKFIETNGNNMEKQDVSNNKINNVIASIDRCLLCDENPMAEFENEIERFDKLTQNNKRNKDNSQILNYKLIEDTSLKQLKNLNDKEIKELVESVLLEGFKNNRIEKQNDKNQNMIKNNLKDELKNQKILLKTIRDIFYYSIKVKEGENVEQYK